MNVECRLVHAYHFGDLVSDPRGPLPCMFFFFYIVSFEFRSFDPFLKFIYEWGHHDRLIEEETVEIQ